jgi:hypothetical protein
MANDCDTLQALARERLAEAKLLLVNDRPSGAYYLAGYAIECALKARIARDFRANEIPDKALVNSVYTHNLPTLLRLAGLEEDLKLAAEAGSPIPLQWSFIAKWSETARYEVWTRQSAADMLDAVGGDEEGVFRWLTDRW